MSKGFLSFSLRSSQDKWELTDDHSKVDAHVELIILSLSQLSFISSHPNPPVSPLLPFVTSCSFPFFSPLLSRLILFSHSFSRLSPLSYIIVSSPPLSSFCYPLFSCLFLFFSFPLLYPFPLSSLVLLSSISFLSSFLSFFVYLSS